MSWKAKKFNRNRHHLTPKKRCKVVKTPTCITRRYLLNGEWLNADDAMNVLFINIERHDYWHRIFGLRTLEEVIALLQRLARAKGRS